MSFYRPRRISTTRQPTHRKRLTLKMNARKKLNSHVKTRIKITSVLISVYPFICPVCQKSPNRSFRGAAHGCKGVVKSKYGFKYCGCGCNWAFKEYLEAMGNMSSRHIYLAVSDWYEENVKSLRSGSHIHSRPQPEYARTPFRTTNPK